MMRLAARQSDHETNMNDSADKLPLHGFDRKTRIPVIEHMSDSKLEEVNNMLPWNAFVVDSHGRRFGNQASTSKRNKPSPVPDPRITMLNETIPLSGKSVLEVGCFEGIHTAALAQYGANVWGCDARIVNIAKSAVRCAFFQVHATFFVWDVEEPLPEDQAREWDILHHIGVLYHLLDPVGHLQEIAPRIRQAILLDTHVAEEGKATATDERAGFTYHYQERREVGYDCVFAGTMPTARWLRPDDLTALLKQLGFAKVDQIELREERNGPRVLILAERE
jgi:2-polyprenyl-3-methyl-5-hydroxy-6-metoxy-1,4-benzoquinol methylase